MYEEDLIATMNETRVITINNTSYFDSNTSDTDEGFTCEINAAPGHIFFAFITNGILLNIVGFFGILGNIISMIILSRPQMKSSINYLLTGLARCDTVLILTSMLLFGLQAIYPYSGYLSTYYNNVLPHMAPVLYPLATIVQTASVYLTLTVTLERYVAVCHPLKARSLCTYGRARIYVFVIIVFSVLYNLPRFWEIEHRSNFDPTFNTTIYCVVASNLRQNMTYISVYIHWLYLVFLYFLPFLFLAIFNVAIYRQVRKANAERQRLSRLQRREIGLATMLLFVVSVFFLCNILPLIVNILEYFYDYINDPLVKISNLLVTINSSINFIIYVIFGEKFKRLFLKLFCSHGLFGVGGRDSPDGATHDDSFMSCADRQSLRLQRTNTTVSRNGVSLRLNGTHSKDSQIRRSVRIRAPSPGPCVYYPALRGSGKEDISDTPPTQSTLVSADWEHDHTSNTTGF